jgi:hypothetical protein
MAQPDSDEIDALKIDTTALYREESITDTRSATIKRLTPVDIEGNDDSSRTVLFIGDTTLMTQMGLIPVQFPIEATDLKSAFELFPDGVKEAVQKLQERAQEMAREESQRIVVPGQGGQGGSSMGGGMPGLSR